MARSLLASRILPRNELVAAIATAALVCGLCVWLGNAGVVSKPYSQVLWLGKPVAKWPLAICFTLVTITLWLVIKAVIDKLWPDPAARKSPEEEWETTQAKPWEDGGTFTYGPPDLNDQSTALDYLEYWLMHEPTDEHMFAESGYAPTDKGAGTVAEHRRKTEDWLAKAPEQTLRDLLPTLRKSALELDVHLAHRLCLAHQVRGIPTREELRHFADEASFEELKSMLATSV